MSTLRRVIAVMAIGVVVIGALLGFVRSAAAGETMPIQVHLASLTEHECIDGEWHFVINQLASDELAPSGITVYWGRLSEVVPLQLSEVVPLWKVSGGVAHYVTTSHLDLPVTNATAVIYSDWGGLFNLSHGPCVPPTNTPTATATVTSTATSTATEPVEPSATPTNTETPESSVTPTETPENEPSETPTQPTDPTATPTQPGRLPTPTNPPSGSPAYVDVSYKCGPDNSLIVLVGGSSGVTVYGLGAPITFAKDTGDARTLVVLPVGTYTWHATPPAGSYMQNDADGVVDGSTCGGQTTLLPVTGADLTNGIIMAALGLLSIGAAFVLRRKR